MTWRRKFSMAAASGTSGGTLGTPPARRELAPGVGAGVDTDAGAGVAARLLCVVAMDPSALPGRAQLIRSFRGLLVHLIVSTSSSTGMSPTHAGLVRGAASCAVDRLAAVVTTVRGRSPTGHSLRPPARARSLYLAKLRGTRNRKRFPEPRKGPARASHHSRVDAGRPPRSLGLFGTQRDFRLRGR